MPSNMEYLHLMNKKSGKTIALLGKLHAFKTALESDVGKYLLADAVGRHSALLEQVTTGEVSENERVELKVLSEILTRWSKKIELYETKREEFKKETASP